MTQVKPTWLGHFYGGSLGFLHYEVLTIQHIPFKEYENEAELMASKWFDYRRLHPMQATYYFVKCYTEAYQAFYRKAIDAEVAPFVRCIKKRDFLEAKERLSMWRLRRLCDQLGMRYDFFLNFAMNYHYRMMTNDGKVYPPRPAHLLNNEDLIADAVIAWEEQCQATLQIAADPYYRTSQFVGSRDQLAHEAFVVGLIKQRRVPKYSLHVAMYLRDVVRIEEALRHFDNDVIKAAIAEVVMPVQISQS